MAKKQRRSKLSIKRKKRLNFRKKLAIVLNTTRIGLSKYLGIGDYNDDYNNDYWIGN